MGTICWLASKDKETMQIKEVEVILITNKIKASLLQVSLLEQHPPILEQMLNS